MDNVSRTMYIPLYGKACVSSSGIILNDPDAERIWAANGFALKGKSRSKWLAYYMGMRAAVMDGWLVQQLQQNPDALVLHLGCGLDSRCNRVGKSARLWVDVDFPDVIAERKRHYTATDTYRMLAADLCDPCWTDQLPDAPCALVVMEGVSMYMQPEAITALFAQLSARYAMVHLLMDCYTVRAARLSRYRNPINDVGVTQVYGLDDPAASAAGTGLAYVQQHSITPSELISQLPRREQPIFRTLYAGKMAEGLYRLYEYKTKYSTEKRRPACEKHVGRRRLMLLGGQLAQGCVQRIGNGLCAGRAYGVRFLVMILAVSVPEAGQVWCIRVDQEVAGRHNIAHLVIA